MLKIITLFTVLLFSSGQIFANSGKVIFLRGTVGSKIPKGPSKKLSLGDIVVKNTYIFTKKKSVVRIKFDDGSVISIGPKSKMVISFNKPGKPTFVELIKGTIRGTVKKHAKPKDGFEHKMYIKTRSASIGVRGTDFVLNYNDKNHITSNITLRGNVEIYKKTDEEIFESIREEYDEKGRKVSFGQSHHLDNTADELKHHNVMSIGKGNFSGAFPSYDKPIAPVKISPQQVDALIKNKNLLKERKGKVLKGKSKIAFNGSRNDILVPQPRKSKSLEKEKYNSITNSDGVRPGGHVDLNTGIYIAPPSNAKFDTNKGVYEMPDGLGGIDSETGHYVPPEGVKLHALNGFVASEKVYKDRKLRKNWNKIKNLTGSFNKKFNEGMKIFKEMSRIDFLGFADYRYTTNVMEDYYGEYRFITNLPSMVWDLKSFAGMQILHTKNYLVYPKASISALFYERALPDIKRNNTYQGMLGIEVHLKHVLFGKKARFIFDTELKTEYTDYRKRNLFDFYTEDASLKMIERLSFNRFVNMEFYYQIRSYQGHEERNHGNIHNGGFNNKFYLGKHLDFLIGFEHSERRDKINGQAYKIENSYGKFVWKDFVSRSDLTMGYTTQWHHTRKKTSLTPFREARFYKLDLVLDRKLGNFWKLNGIYEFKRQRAKGIGPTFPENRSFIEQSFGGGLSMYF